MEKAIGEVKLYGNPPRNIVLLHGGPGAQGEMEPVALILGKIYGVLEPMQTKKSVWKQVEELKAQIESCSREPVTLVGFSWGAWLAYLFASKYTDMVKKLILVSSGPFEEPYVKQIRETRLLRLNKPERKRVEELEKLFNQKEIKNIDKLFGEYGGLLSKADTYMSNGEELEYDSISPQMEVYNGVWPEVASMRRSGKLIKLGEKMTCPVVAIHGDFDPHPYRGVKEPLSKILSNFKFFLLYRSGHHPWFEKHAKGKFYDLLERELQ